MKENINILLFQNPDPGVNLRQRNGQTDRRMDRQMDEKPTNGHTNGEVYPYVAVWLSIHHGKFR